MKMLLILCLLFLYSSTSLASPSTDSLISKLNQAIKSAQEYDNYKLIQIFKLKGFLNEPWKSDLEMQHKINLQLYNEYKYYNYDSALHYAKILQRQADEKNDYSLVIDSKLKEVFIILSAGMFKETFDVLNTIYIETVADSVKAEYYTLMGRAYLDLVDFNADSYSTQLYNKKANLYLDSALLFLPSGSFDHNYYSALQFLKKGNSDSALSKLLQLLEKKDLNQHQNALATSTIGGIYLEEGLKDKAIPYLIAASISDIKSSTKETLALLTLAGLIYEKGNIEESLLYIEKANADAAFYNARLRKVQVGTILPLIEGGMITTIKSQKEKLQVFLFALSILVLLLGSFAMIILNQVKKLKIARAKLSEANLRLQHTNHELVQVNELKEKYNAQLKIINNELHEANETKEKYNLQLQKTNHQLSEAHKIKEEYIGYYFNLDTEYLAKTEKLITAIEKKLVERRWEEIKIILKTFDAKKEKDELVKNFDKVFLRLFPNFVQQFNSLFKEEDKITLKEPQLLNTDLRIFALIRIGITENEKIAEILGYSINTIYAKKTKVRSKTIINKEEFERRIGEITTLS